jgi:hypothetical protein
MKNTSTTKLFVTFGAVALALGIVATSAPDAAAAPCANGQSDCGGTCYSPASQRCYAGVLCSNADQYCPGPRACFNPGTQKCCPTTVVAGGASCPQITAPSSTLGPSAGQPQNSGSGNGAVVNRVVPGSACYSNLLCPVFSTVVVTRTPIAPSGWTSGASITSHPAKVDENADRVRGTGANSWVTCWYGVGAGLYGLAKQTQSGPLGAGVADDADGFCVH